MPDLTPGLLMSCHREADWFNGGQPQPNFVECENQLFFVSLFFVLPSLSHGDLLMFDGLGGGGGIVGILHLY